MLCDVIGSYPRVDSYTAYLERGVYDCIQNRKQYIEVFVQSSFS